MKKKEEKVEKSIEKSQVGGGRGGGRLIERPNNWDKPMSRGGSFRGEDLVSRLDSVTNRATSFGDRILA